MDLENKDELVTEVEVTENAEVVAEETVEVVEEATEEKQSKRRPRGKKQKI